MRAVPAAGTIPWRLVDGNLEVALVHRPRYDDWSWPKGKLDPGEEWPVAAARETREETAIPVRLGLPLPPATYPLLEPDGTMSAKEVRYWAATPLGPGGRLVNEIDDVAWVSPTEAHSRLDYARDQEQLLAVVAAHRDGRLDTWPLLVVRHARALTRSTWSKDDWLRPLDRRGLARADALIPLLAAYAPGRLITSSSTRCRDTLAPYAVATATKLRERPELAEESYELDPQAAVAVVHKVLRRAVPTALCTHRPVLPELLAGLAVLGATEEAAEVLTEAADLGMGKGEVLVAHTTGAGADARIVAVERHHA